jgi:hypothetical protein
MKSENSRKKISVSIRTKKEERTRINTPHLTEFAVNYFHKMQFEGSVIKNYWFKTFKAVARVNLS